MRPFEEKIVKLTLDINAFKANSVVAIGTLGRVKDAITSLGKGDTKGASQALKAVTDETANAESGMAKVTEVTKKTSAAFEALKVMGTGALLSIGHNLANKVISTMKKFTLDPITDGFKEYELKMKSVQTIITNTGESVGVVNKILDALNTYSDRTIYNFNDMTKAIGSLSTSGMKLEDSASVVKGFFNLAAGTGVEAARASSLLDTAMVQAIQIGKMDYQNWKQLQQAGMGGPKFKDALIANAKAMGKNIDLSNGFNESLKQGWATTDVMLATLKEFEKDQSLLDAATKVRTFSQLMDTALESVGSGWAQTWEIIFGNFDEATNLWSGVWNAIEPVIEATSNLRNGFLEIFKTTGGFKALFGIFGNVYRFIKQITDAIGDGFTNSLGRLSEGLKLIPKMLTIPFKMVELVTRKIADIKLIPIVIGGAFKALFSVFGLLSSAILNVIDVVVSVYDWFKRLGTLVVTLSKQSPFVTWVKPLVDLKNKMQEFAKAIPFGKLKDEFLVFKESIESIAIDPLVDAFKALVSPIVAIGKSISTLSLDPIKEWSKGASEMMTSSFTGAKEAILKLFSVSFWKDDLFGGMKTAFKNMKSIFDTDEMLKKIKTDMSGIGSAIKEMFTFELPSLKIFDDFFKGLDFKASFANLAGLTAGVNLSGFENLNGVFKAMTELVGLAGEAISKFIKLVKSNLSSVIEWIGIKFGDTKKQVHDLADAFTIVPIIEAIDGWIGAVKEFNDGIDWSPITKKLEALADKFNSFKNIIKDAFEILPLTNWTEKIQNGVQSIIDSIFGLNKTTVQNGISEGIKGIADAADGTKSVMQKFGEAIKNVFVKIGEYAVIGVQYTIDGLKMIWNALVENTTRFGTFLSDMWSDMSNFHEKVAEWSSKIRDFFKDTFSTENLVKGGMLAYFGLMIKGLFDFQKNSNGIMGAIKDGFQGLADIPNALKEIKDQLLGFTKSITPANILKIAGAIAILALSIKLLSTIDSEALASTLGYMAMGVGSLLVIFGSLAVVSKLDLSGGMLKSAAAISSISTAILVMSGALKVLSTIDEDGMTRALRALLAVVGFMSVVMLVIGKFSVGSVSISIKGIMGMASALLIISEAVRKFAEIPTEDLMKGMTAVIVGMTAMTVALMLIGNSKFGVFNAVGIIGIATSLVILASAVKILAGLPIKNMMLGMAAITGMLVTMSLSLAVLSVNGAKTLLAATAISMVSMSLSSLIIPIGILGSMSLSTLAKGIGTVTLALTAITLALAALSFNAVGSLAAAASIVAVSAALTLLIVPITILGTMKWQTLVQGMGAMAIALGLIIAAGYLATGAAPGLLALSVSIVAISAAALLVVGGLMATIVLLEAITTKSKDAFGALVDNILYFMNRIKMALPQFTSFAIEIVNSFATVMESAIPRLATAGINIIMGILEAISANIYKFTVLAIVIVLQFAQALTDNVKPIVDAAIKLAIALIEGLAEGINKNAHRFAGAMRKLIGAVLLILVEGLELLIVTMAGWIPGVEKKATEAGDAATEAIRKAFNLKDPADEKMQEFAEGIEDGTPDAEKAARNTGKATNKALGEEDTKETGSNLIDDFLKGIGSKTGDTEASASDLSETLNLGLGSANTGKTGIAEIDEYLESITGKDKETKNTGEKTASELNTGLGSADTKKTGNTKAEEYAKGVEDRKGNVKKKAEDVADAADKGLGSKDTKKTGNTKADEYGKGIEEKKQSVQTKSEGVAASANRGMSNTNTYNTGGMKVDEYSRGISNNKEKGKTSGKGVSFAANQGLGTNSGFGPGNVQAGQYNRGLGSGRSTAYDTGASVSSRGNSGLKSVSAWESGKNFIQGFINGLKWKKKDVEGASYAMGAASKAFLDKGAGNASPSKKAFESGNWFGQGMVNGVVAMTKAVSNSAFGLGEGAVKALDKSTSNFKPAFENIVNENLDMSPTIKPIFDLSNLDTREFSRTFRAFSNNNFEVATATVSQNNQNEDKSGEVTNNFEFNITGDNPKSIAREVEKIITRRIMS